MLRLEGVHPASGVLDRFGGHGDEERHVVTLVLDVDTVANFGVTGIAAGASDA